MRGLLLLRIVSGWVICMPSMFESKNEMLSTLQGLLILIIFHRFVALCLTLTFIIGVVLLRFYDPTSYSFIPRCPFYVLTGLKCPGCGTLRAIHSAFNGRFGEAIAWNPILLIAIPIVIVLLISPSVARHKYVGHGIFGVIILYWIIRNLI